MCVLCVIPQVVLLSIINDLRNTSSTVFQMGLLFLKRYRYQSSNGTATNPHTTTCNQFSNGTATNY